MQHRFDVIVVGAGPAGSTAAMYAARQGADVLLIDKKEEIGVPVCCGEFLPSAGLIAEAFPRAPGLDELWDIDPCLIQRKTTSMVVVSPKGREYEFAMDGWTIHRDAFDRHLAQAAVGEGAVLSTATKFLRLDGCSVVTSRESFEAKVVIAADGPLSPVCRSAGLERNGSLSPAATCQVQGEYDDAVRLFFGKTVAPGGYAWIIPKRGCANVGLGVQHSRQPLRKLLASFLARMGFDAADVQGCYVPVSGPIRETVRGNVLAVGDAAGHVMATNGGGIPIALICGRIAGLAAAGHILQGMPLTAYEEEWRSAVGRELAMAVKTKQTADAFMKSDFLLEQMMSMLNVAGLERVIKYCGMQAP
jgi:digeranylgeranylglycerophospholipid reductase